MNKATRLESDRPAPAAGCAVTASIDGYSMPGARPLMTESDD